jgi:hypothetical protein
MKITYLLGGICALIVGIRDTNAIIIAPIEPILFDSTLSWKKIAKFIRDKKSKGTRIVAIATLGNLYSGTLK